MPRTLHSVFNENAEDYRLSRSWSFTRTFDRTTEQGNVQSCLCETGETWESSGNALGLRRLFAAPVGCSVCSELFTR